MLTPLYKGGTALGAADLDFPFASGYADLLPAGGTVINVMGLTLLEIIFLFGQKGPDPGSVF